MVQKYLGESLHPLVMWGCTNDTEYERGGVVGTVTGLQAVGARRLPFDSRRGQEMSLFSLST